MIDQQRLWEEEFLHKVYQKLSCVSEEINALNPYSIVDGRYDNLPMPPYSWTCGFWGGIQWWLYKLSGEEKFLRQAKAASERMDGGLTAFTPLAHDVGFQYLFTTVADYLNTGSERACTSSIHAATLLTGRFNLAGRYIRAWNDGEGPGVDSSRDRSGYVIIDSMMNLPLLFWASEETGDPRYKQIAMAHADTVMREFIRENGSSNHIVVFDPESGMAVNKPRGQGYAAGSSWTRGQSWAIYGFAMTYRYTGKREYLNTALRVARYFLKKLPENGVPPVDFDQPQEPSIVDASAGVIAACGLIELKKWSAEEDWEWLESGIRQLLRGAYLNSNFEEDNQAVLHRCMALYHGEQKQISLVYADFYLLEALMKRRGEDLLFV